MAWVIFLRYLCSDYGSGKLLLVVISRGDIWIVIGGMRVVKIQDGYVSYINSFYSVEYNS